MMTPDDAAALLNQLATLAAGAGGSVQPSPAPAAPRLRRRGRGEGGITQLPSGSYRATVSLGIATDGKRIRETFTAPSKAELMDRLRRRLDEVRPAGRPCDELGLTLGQWLARWLAESATRTEPSTYQCRASRLKNYFAGRPIAGLMLFRMRAGDVRQWLASLEEEGRPVKECVACLTLLKTALNEAVRRELIRNSPADKVRGPKAERCERRPFTQEQALEVMARAEGVGLGLYLALALDTGCRPGELLALRRCDVMEDGRTLDVRRSLQIASGREKGPKTAAGRRRILLSLHVAAMLPGHGDSDSPLISRPDVPSPYKHWLAPSLRRLFNDCGLPWAVAYTTRHTCASLLLRAGVPITTVSQRLGHSNPAITLKHYCHAMPHDQDAAAEVTQRLFAPRQDSAA